MALIGWSKADGVCTSDNGESTPSIYSLFQDSFFGITVDIYYSGEAGKGEEREENRLQMRFDEGTYGDWKKFLIVFRPNEKMTDRQVSRFALTLGLFHKAGKGWIDQIEMYEFFDWVCGDILFHHYLSASLRTNDLLSDSEEREDNNLHNHVHRSNSQDTHSNEEIVPFVLIWTRSSKNFKQRHFAALESIFYHHSNAEVHVISNTLPYDFFHSFWTSGYNVKMHRIDFEHLEYHLPHANAIKFLRKMKVTLEEPYDLKTTEDLYNRQSKDQNSVRQELQMLHLADFLRIAYLYLWGGTAFDFDIILLKPMTHWQHRNFAFADPCEHSSLFWCLPSSFLSREEDTIEDRKMYSVSSGLMSFDRGHPLLDKALSLFDAEYRLEWEMLAVDPECVSHYHHIDFTSKILSIAWKEVKNGNYELGDVGENGFEKDEDGNDEIQLEMRLLPLLDETERRFIGWSEMIELMEADIPEKRWNEIKSTQLYFRLHEKLTGNLATLPNSLSSRVLNSFRISRRDHHHHHHHPL